MFLTFIRMTTSRLNLPYWKRPKRDRWWKIQRMKEQARHFWYRSVTGRVGLCNTHLRRAYVQQTQARIVRPYIRNKLRSCRLEAACRELDSTYSRLRIGLRVSNVSLRTNTLSLLSMYEPRTFERLVEVAERAKIEQLRAKHIELPERSLTKPPPK